MVYIDQLAYNVLVSLILCRLSVGDSKYSDLVLHTMYITTLIYIHVGLSLSLLTLCTYPADMSPVGQRVATKVNGFQSVAIYWIVVTPVSAVGTLSWKSVGGTGVRIPLAGLLNFGGNLVCTLFVYTRAVRCQHRFMCGCNCKQWSNDINESNFFMQPITIQFPVTLRKDG